MVLQISQRQEDGNLPPASTPDQASGERRSTYCRVIWAIVARSRVILSDCVSELLPDSAVIRNYYVTLLQSSK